MTPNNDKDFTLVRNKSNEVDMEVFGEVHDGHIISLRQWSVSVMNECPMPQTTEEWYDYFGEKALNVYVVRDGRAYSLLADGHAPPGGWTADEFDRTYVMAYINENTGFYWTA
jgi:hypothetical protein